MKRKSFEMDMTTGHLPRKILSYAIPFIATGTLQLLFNTADVIVVGRFAGVQALAAVGSTSSLISLIINLFMGLAVGVSVLVSQYFGANNHKGVHQTVHTSITIAAICGVGVSVFGILAAKHLLHLMGSPDDVINLATLYLKIYFLGAPGSLIYNFGASIVRATGDTKRPLIILSSTGIINVVLNLILVVGFHFNVAGVAIATIVAQYISAVLIVIRLANIENACRLNFKKI